MSQSAIEALGPISLETALADQVKIVEFLKKSRLDSQDAAVSGAFLNDMLLIAKELLQQQNPDLADLVKGVKFGYTKKVSDSEENPDLYRVESHFVEDSDWQENTKLLGVDSGSDLLDDDEKTLLDNLLAWLFDGLFILYPSLVNCLEFKPDLYFKLSILVRVDNGGMFSRDRDGLGSGTPPGSVLRTKKEIYQSKGCGSCREREGDPIKPKHKLVSGKCKPC